jgi:hypothetical protein
MRSYFDTDPRFARYFQTLTPLGTLGDYAAFRRTGSRAAARTP